MYITPRVSELSDGSVPEPFRRKAKSATISMMINLLIMILCYTNNNTIL